MRDFLRELFKSRVSAHSYPVNPERFYNALIESSTRALLAISCEPAAIAFVNETMPDTYHIYNVTKPNYRSSLPFSLDEPCLSQWSWDTGGRTFSPTRPDVNTRALQTQSRLAMRKMRAYLSICERLTVARSVRTQSIALQETVYEEKKRQAHAFQTQGYTDDDILSFPYVRDYADFANISFREAADDIILKSKLDDDFLAKTELLRLTYMRALKEAATESHIRPIMKAFRREAFLNAII